MKNSTKYHRYLCISVFFTTFVAGKKTNYEQQEFLHEFLFSFPLY